MSEEIIIEANCEDCAHHYFLKYEGKEEPRYCPFCGHEFSLSEEHMNNRELDDHFYGNDEGMEI